MNSDDKLSVVLSEFARTLATDFPIQGILDHLVHNIVDIMPIDAAGVTLISETTKPRYVASSNEAALRFETLQSDLGEGPCLAAYRGDAPISIPDLTQDDRFPAFARRARAEGLVAVFTFPLRDGNLGLGALDLYRETAGPLDEDEMIRAQTLADVATAYLLNASVRVDLENASARANEAVESLRLLDQAKTEYLTTVIHELKTPMTSIAGYTELLNEGDLDAEQMEHVHAITRNSDRLSALADDLLTLSSLEQATIGQDHMAVDLREILSAAQAVAQPLMEARPLQQVTFSGPATPVPVLGDPQDLERMLTNLVSNALKYTADDGWVRVALLAVGTHARLSVSDNGIGIPKEEQGHLYTRFFRASTAKSRHTPGSGLGLSIVASVVQRHRGTISVESERDGGTSFVVDLPLAPTAG